MELNLIFHCLFYSCLFLNLFSHFLRRARATHLSNLLVNSYHYKILTFPQLVVLFSSDVDFENSNHLWGCYCIPPRLSLSERYIILGWIWLEYYCIQPVSIILPCRGMQRTLAIFAATIRIFCKEETTAIAKKLTLLLINADNF